MHMCGSVSPRWFVWQKDSGCLIFLRVFCATSTTASYIFHASPTPATWIVMSCRRSAGFGYAVKIKPLQTLRHVDGAGAKGSWKKKKKSNGSWPHLFAQSSRSQIHNVTAEVCQCGGNTTGILLSVQHVPLFLFLVIQCTLTKCFPWRYIIASRRRTC